MASTYNDLNYTMDLSLLKDQLEPEFPMPDDYSTPDEFAEEETALLDGFVTDYRLITDLRYEETIKVTNEDVPVPHVVMKVEPFSEDDSGIQSQVSLSDNSEDELLPSKENSEDEPLLAKETSFSCELNHSTENIPEYNIVVIREGKVKFQIEEYEDEEEDQEKMKNGINYRIDKIKDQPVTSSFYQRKMLECQSSVSFNMDDIHSGSSDDTQDTYLTLGTVDSTDTICQSLLPWRRDDDDIERAEMPKAALVEQKSEAWYRIAIEICLPFLMSGFGCIMAGYVLGIVQHWNVFVKVSEIFILVPALLGLKGNLEMTLASRLSTQANIGNMDDPREQWKMIGGNLALTQAQAVVVGFLAAIAAMLLAWIPEGKFDIHHAFLLCASSVLTAALASLILGSVMIAVVLLSRKCKINPDNVATPIAASLGDLTTLALLSALANFFWNSLGGNRVWIAPTFLCIALVLTPLWCYISYKNKYVKEVLISGWSPVIGAMMISSVGGLILDFAVATYHGIAVFQPVINGVGGNLVAVQASRLSTALHQNSKPGVLPDDAPQACPNPCTTFFGKGANGRTARVLLLLVIPGHLIFIYTISYMQAGHTSITPVFASVYLTAAMLQVIALLYLANWLVHWLWKRGNDPDNFSIPYLTALGDLLGGALLAIAFHILYLVGDKDAD